MLPGRPVPAAITTEQAKLALILGIISWIACGFPTGIPAVLVGRKAIRQIKQSRGRFKGQELALAGVVLGYASCAAWLVFLVAGYSVYRTIDRQGNEDEASAVDAIRQINSAEASYAQIYGGSSGRLYADSLAALGPGPTGTCAGTGSREYACLMNGPLVMPDCREPHWCILKDYKFLLQTQYTYPRRKLDYSITAVPLEGRPGIRTFCSTSDGVIRFNVVLGTLRDGYNAEDCSRQMPLDKDK